ncbi:MAG: sugar phosphate isomerase/epimerase [Clostridia bacterium]|nr:sugar phosphate isomerase/epimerase [Clostridia bacterium]
MKIGICGAPEYWAEIRKLGYDYAEGYFRGIAIAGDEEFEKMHRYQQEAELPVEAVNGIFAKDIPLYEGKETNGIIETYADKGFYRAKLLGGEITVFGSGAARAIPEGMEKERAKERFAEVLCLLGNVAKRNGMKLALEPLRYGETNFINTLSDAAQICEYAGHSNVGITLDFFHFYSNGESLATVPDAKKYIIHAHLARPNPDRKIPAHEDLAECRKWADTLRSIDYDERISLEAVFEKDLIGDCKKAYPIMQIFR